MTKEWRFPGQEKPSRGPVCGPITALYWRFVGQIAPWINDGRMIASCWVDDGPMMTKEWRFPGQEKPSRGLVCGACCVYALVLCWP